MVCISEVQALFPFVEPARQMLQIVNIIRASFTRIAGRLVPCTGDADAALWDTLKGAAHALRECAAGAATFLGALAAFVRAVAACFTVDGAGMTKQVAQIGEAFKAFADGLAGFLGACGRAVAILDDLDGRITDTLMYPRAVRGLVLGAWVPLVRKCCAVRLSPRAVMLTTGRDELRALRVTVIEFSGLAHFIKACSFDAFMKIRFSDDVLKEIRARSCYWRAATECAVGVIITDLNKTSRETMNASKQISWQVSGFW
ncbi:hypothetical protein HDZ31DRAFT_63722 [Schizophyllum fasciatum]